MVKGQNGKTLATAGAIKGPLPCPEMEREKQNIFTEWKEKTEQEEKKKDMKENKEKRKETKEKES